MGIPLPRLPKRRMGRTNVEEGDGMNIDQLKWKLFRENIQALRETVKRLRNQTGEIMMFSVWWLPGSTMIPVEFDPVLMDLRKGTAFDTRSKETVNIRDLLKSVKE